MIKHGESTWSTGYSFFVGNLIIFPGQQAIFGPIILILQNENRKIHYVENG